jgi:hypothetical protein
MEPAGSVVRRRGSQADGHFPADNPESLRSSGILWGFEEQRVAACCVFSSEEGTPIPHLSMSPRV